MHGPAGTLEVAVMAKFLIGVLTGIILVGLFLFIAIFALARMREKPPTVADGSTLVLDLEGEIPERAPVEFPIPFLQRRTPLTVADVWGTLRKATTDGRIRAIIFENITSRPPPAVSTWNLKTS
jgi:hypothetical protein